MKVVLSSLLKPKVTPPNIFSIVTTNNAAKTIGEDKTEVERKIESATEGLTPQFSKSLHRISGADALKIACYIISLKTEINPSIHYRGNIILCLTKLLRFVNDHYATKALNQINREEVLAFLDNFRKSESVDPMHKWIGTYNLQRAYLTKFFKWLYNPHVGNAVRPTPPIVENIGHLKRREMSIYKPTDLWTEEDDRLFLKYCPSKRMKCYHTVSMDMSSRPHEILKLKIRDIVFKTSGNYKYAEVLLNGKTGTRHIPLINSIPHVKDYLDHEHPQPSNPRAPFICGIGKSLGRAIGERALFKIYDNYKKEYFPKLMYNPNITPEDKQKIRELLKKPWNPYIRRHTGLTEKSFMLKSHVLNQYAGWTQGSVMSQKYLHYFGNESSENILEAYGIITKDKNQSSILAPKQCPNCNEPNKPDSKFCGKCRMVLTYDAYSETIEDKQQKDDEIQRLKEQMVAMQEAQKEICDLLKDPVKLSEMLKLD